MLIDTNMSPEPSEITQLLQAWRHGDPAAADELVKRVYGELRRVAARQLRRERESHTLEPTALVHEAYMRLIKGVDIDWQDRNHFFGVAARLMRQVLVDHARRQLRRKRGGNLTPLPLGEDLRFSYERPESVIALDLALERLAEIDRVKASIVELHFFGGFSVEETAEILESSTATVSRHWRMAKTWLAREVGSRPEP